MKAFVFSDIVASTRLKNSLPGKTQAERDRLFIDAVLEPHRRLLESDLAVHGGRLVKTLGDGCFLVFDSPVNAALWAMEVQTKHQETPIRLPNGSSVGVKIGIHHGEATLDPQDPSDYSGRNVDYAARLVELATEGRVIISRSMYAQLEDAGIYGVRFHEHGERELRGIGAKSVYELLFNDRHAEPLKGDSSINIRSGSSGGGPRRAGSNAAVQEMGSSVTTGSMIGNYLLGRRIGSGAMGTVYQAEHAAMAQTFAIKVIDEKLLNQSEHNIVSRFYREVKAVSRLNHPNIVRAHNASLRSDPIHYLVMEFLDGLSLDKMVTTRLVGWQFACEMIRRAAAGLEYIHQNELVHRDIKPSNLLLTYPSPGQESEIKILDLGLALLLDEERETRVQNSVMGSAYYMSPEQWQSSQVDIRADIYSLGCTFYHLITGRAPFQDSAYNQKYAHQNLPPEPFPSQLGVPREVWRIAERMLAKHPDDRFTTPQLLSRDLEQVLPPMSLSAFASSLQDSATRANEKTEIPVDTDSEVVAPSSRSLASHAYPRASRFRFQRWLAKRSRSVTLGLVVSIAIVGLVWWSLINNPKALTPKTHLADEVASITNIETAPGAIGDWWFKQTPWLTPTVRDELAKMIAAEETELSIRQRFEAMDQLLANGYMGEFERELIRFRQEYLTGRVGEREMKSLATLESLSESFGRNAIAKLISLESVLSGSNDPRELHLLAAVQHRLGSELAAYLSASGTHDQRKDLLLKYLQSSLSEVSLQEPTDYFRQAQANYTAALDAYPSQHRLRALAYADFARLAFEAGGKIAFDEGHKEASLNRMQLALKRPGEQQTIFAQVLHLCSQAYMYRKQGEAEMAIATLMRGLQILDGNDAEMEIGPMHPVRLALQERLGWANFERWDLVAAEEHFATYIDCLDEIQLNQAQHWIEPMQVYRSHANMGRYMAMHYRGRQEEAVSNYQSILDDLGQSGSVAIRRRSLNYLDRLADAQMFGPHPNHEAAIEAFQRYGELEADLNVPALPILLKELRHCIALALSGRSAEARELFDSIAKELNSQDERAQLGFRIARILCKEEADVTDLVNFNRQLIETYENDKTKPHPHLAQLMLLATEVASVDLRSQVNGSSGPSETMIRNVSTLLQVIEQIQSPDQPLNPFFVRYLQASEEAVAVLIEIQEDDALEESLRQIRICLAGQTP